MTQKWVLITGVCGGIGRASASAFNNAGWKVIGADRTDPLEPLDLDMGGGGHYHLLYFLIRHTLAKNVVETGVAAGWSSQAILLALKENKENGQLYSSDFPYFRYKNPEELVGYIVDEELKNSKIKLRRGNLGDVAPTVLDLLGLEKPEEMYGISVFKL